MVFVLKCILCSTKFLLRPRPRFSCNRILNVFQFAGRRCSAMLSTRHNNAQGLNSDRGSEMWALMLQWNLPVLYPVTSLSLSKTEGKSKNPPFVSAHYISAVIVPSESPVCGSFQQGTVTGSVNWTWLGSPSSLIVSMTDWGLLGQNCIHTVTYNPIWGLNEGHHNKSKFEKKLFYFSFFSRELSKYILVCFSWVQLKTDRPD